MLPVRVKIQKASVCNNQNIIRDGLTVTLRRHMIWSKITTTTEHKNGLVCEISLEIKKYKIKPSVNMYNIQICSVMED